MLTRLGACTEPFRNAVRLLDKWLRSLSFSPDSEESIKRAEVLVDWQNDPLQWLRIQTATERMYFKCRSGRFEVACLGFARKEQGAYYTKTIHQSLMSRLRADMPMLRYYGGLRFDKDCTSCSSEWSSFSGYTFILPLLEMQRFDDGTACLALNVINQYSQEYAKRILHSAEPPPAYPLALRIARAVSVREMDSYRAWCKTMEKILSSISAGVYEKIVLSRRKRFFYNAQTMVDAADILGLFAQDTYDFTENNSVRPSNEKSFGDQNGAFSWDNGNLGCTPTENIKAEGGSPFADDGDNKGTKYIFCIQLSENEAFLGSTPECLFRKVDSEIDTQAVAGTAPYGPGAMEELFSEKNIEEHRYVVDFLSAALARCGFSTETQGPRVLRLPRLMHLATSIKARVNHQDFSLDAVDTSTNLYELLCELHPTPAVCGFPKSITMTSLQGLEDFDRGYYAGPFGWFSKRESEFCVAIRSALVHKHSVTAYAGSGIVRASEPKAEWDETELKMSLLSDALTPPDDMLESVGIQHGEASSTHLVNPKNSLPPYLSDLPNLNTLWCFCVIEELARCGIDQYFVAPGSRSAPLVIGITLVNDTKWTIAHDERGAGFLAVGYARATGRPAAVVTTSGTAVANLLPAVVEASADGIPILILTADRPPELRDVGANQSINQVNIFGGYTRWFKDIPCPSEDIPLRNVLSDVDYAVAFAGHLNRYRHPSRPGPVHLNFMFRENLAPDSEAWNRRYLLGLTSWYPSSSPLTKVCTVSSRSSASLMDRDIKDFKRILYSSQKGVILAGNGAGLVSENRRAILKLATELQWPIIADIASGLRYDSSSDFVIAYADLLLSSPRIMSSLAPDVIIRFGGKITSKRITALMRNTSEKLLGHILVAESSVRVDECFSVTHHVDLPAETFVSEIARSIGRLRISKNAEKSNCIRERSTSSELMKVRQFSRWIEARLSSKALQSRNSPLQEPLLAYVLSREVAQNEAIFASNSMPIRDLDTFGGASYSYGFDLKANRGASGIDGILSSAIGYWIGRRRKTTVMIGDMAMLHDLNALHLMRDHQGPRLTIVVVNNGGGGIFSILPIAKYVRVSELFNTPHSLKFDAIASAFGLRYMSARTLEQFQSALRHLGPKSRIIEAVVPNDHSKNAEFRNSLCQDLLRECEKQVPHAVPDAAK